MLNKNNLVEVNSFKLLTKENLLFSLVYKDAEFLPIESGFFDHQNCVEKSKEKHCGYFD